MSNNVDMHLNYCRECQITKNGNKADKKGLKMVEKGEPSQPGELDRVTPS